MVRVELGANSYTVRIADTLAGFGAFVRDVRPPAGRAFIIADGNIVEHADAVEVELRSAGFDTRRAVTGGEANKNLTEAARLYDELAAWPADRQTLVVAVGGGVVGDLGGFVAATYARGLPLVIVPTTLLALVDSSVGGKVGVNLPRGKNLVGAFHRPCGVWANVGFLATLPEREYRSGLAEVVKYGVSLDAEFFHWLESNAAALLERDPMVVSTTVAKCCALKAAIVAQDEREETGLRMVLNYGHTFAHAFETLGGYGTWLHGEAVAAGMVCAARLAERLGLCSPEVGLQQNRLLEVFGLPTQTPAWPVEELLAVMKRDKKARLGSARFVLPRELGRVTWDEPADDEIVADVLRASRRSQRPA